MAGSLVVGLACKLYYNAGTYMSPTWTLIPAVKDLKLNLSKSTADAASRQYTWKMVLACLKEASLEYEILANPSDNTYTTLQSAYLNDTDEDMAIANGLIATNGTEYFRADWLLTGFSLSEPLQGVRTASVKQELLYSTNAQAFTEVGS